MLKFYELLCLDVQNVLKRSSEIPLKLEGKILNVSIEFKSNYLKSFPDKIQETLPQTHNGEHHVEPPIMDYIMNVHDIENEFGFKSFEYDRTNSTFHFTKDFHDVQEADEFKQKLRQFFKSFSKEEIKIPKGIFQKLKEAIENERDKFGEMKIDFVGLRVSLVGKKEDVTSQRQKIEEMMDTVSVEAMIVPIDHSVQTLVIEDLNKLIFLNFVDYFMKITIEYPGVRIDGTESLAGELRLTATAEMAKDVQVRIFQDLSKITEIEVGMSHRQLEFLKKTKCRMVNHVLKKYEVMLMLVSVEGAVDGKGLRAKIMTLRKYKDNEVRKVFA